MSEKETVPAMQWNPVVWVSDSRTFLLEVRSEFRKVTWPSQQEATAGTIGVVVVCVIVTSALAGVDFALSQLVQLILP